VSAKPARNNDEKTLNREMKFVLWWKIWAMSNLHFGGERYEQDRKNRTVHHVLTGMCNPGRC
jgi:hypothetical protein